MKNYIRIRIIFFAILMIAPINVYAYKYGLGSCLDQDREQNIWSSIKNEDLDGFIFLGDNVYGDIPNGKLSKNAKGLSNSKKKIT